MGRVGVALGILGMQALIVFLLIWGLKIPKRYALWIVALFATFYLPLPYILWLQAGARQPGYLAAALIVRPCFAWIFNWLCFLIFIAPVVVLVRIGAGLFGAEVVITVMRYIVLLIALMTGAATAYGLWDTTRPPVVEEHEIEIKGLSQRDDGLRIVQLTDPHAAWWTSRREICHTGQMIADLKPDLFVITGDVVDHNPVYVHHFADCMDKVTPRLGRYAIIGNHDVYTGHEAIARLMEERGFRMLRDEWVSLEDKDTSLLLVGIDDSGLAWTGADPQEKRMAEIIADRPSHLPVILLAHRPSVFRHVKDLPVALTLTGHTHGGQLKLPFGGPGLANLGFRRVSGLHRRGDQFLYISRGTGSVGWPFRLFCSKEITLIKLISTE